MDLITKSKALRLQSHLDKYLVANDDCTTVRLCRNSLTRRSIWIAEPSPGPTGASSVRLKNDSTGLYLAASDVSALLMTGKRVVQAPLFINNNDRMMSLIFDWEPIRDVDGGLKIKLKARGAHGKFLRANSGPPPWNNSVTHDAPTTGATKFWTLWDVVPVEAPEYEGKEVKSSPLPFHTNPASNSYSTTTNTTSSVASTSDYVQSPHIVLGGVREFTHEELSQATNTFSRETILGRGGFGIVYRGVLSGGYVAVKKLQIGSFQGEREFVTEINVLSRIHHKNLVSLVGYCVSGLDRLLVYEYVENNSLAFHLQGNATSVLLNWPTRMRIALDAAKGIAYLHEECYPKIIHRDIKSANILVDSNFRAKVADFGLAKSVLDDKIHVTKRIVGSLGYLAPEFGSSGKFTNKSDVYSFGVVLLELITGRKPADLVDWACPILDQALEDGEVETQLIDPKLAGNYNQEEMKCMVACAAVSIRRFADSRPQMSQVVQVLEGNISPEKLKAETSYKSMKRRFIYS